MLDFLNVTNGNLSPKFDSLNNMYTVTIKSDVEKLDINYITSNNEIVNINGNENFSLGENIVIVEVINNIGEITEYTLLVNKEETHSAFGYSNNAEVIEVVPAESVPVALAPLSVSIIFLLIILTFYFLFLKKKKTKNY